MKACKAKNNNRDTNANTSHPKEAKTPNEEVYPDWLLDRKVSSRSIRALLVARGLPPTLRSFKELIERKQS